MTLRPFLLALVLPLALTRAATAAPGTLNIRLAHDSADERATAAQLQRLNDAHDLARWTFTRDVVIDDDAIPHSHPVLTLHTRHLMSDDLLLSTYVHEQLHHHLDAHAAERAAAVRELKRLYPRIPVGYPEGSDGAEGNYDHLIVISNERQADIVLMGELRAHAVMQFWADDHYRWLYRAVLRDPGRMAKVVRTHQLAP